MADENKSVMLRAYTTKELGELAQKMAQDRIDGLKKVGMGFGYAKDQKKANENQAKAFNMLANQYYMRMVDGSMFNGLDEQKLRDGRYTNTDLRMIADGEYTPQTVDDEKLVKSLKNFDDLGLEEKARLATEVGYDWGDKESRNEFLKKVADFRTQAERGDLLADWDESTQGKIMSIIYPTANADVRRAIATGEGMDKKSDVYKDMAFDAAVNTAVAAAPGISAGIAGKVPGIAKAGEAIGSVAEKLTPEVVKKITSVPEFGALYGAGKQTAAEIGREAAQGAFDVGDREFNLEGPALTFVAGATIPGLSNLPGRLASANQIQSKTLRDLMRGLQMSNRQGNPVAIEANNLRRGLGNAGKFDLLAEMTPAQRIEKEMAENAVKREQILKESLGHEGKAYDPNDIEGSLNSYSGKVRYENGLPNADDEAVWQNFKTAFPQKSAEMEQKSKARTAGYALGSILSDVGGRIEPVTKVSTDYMTPLDIDTDYRNTEWYKKMSEPMRKVYDEAYERKVKLLADEEK